MFELMPNSQPLFPADRTEAAVQLLERIDQAEKENKDPFFYFNDRDVLHYYLYRSINLNKEAERSDRTLNEYERELSQMIQNMMHFPYEIGLDIEQIEEGSLFKSLSPRHLRRYQTWLAEESPHVKKKGSYSAATLARKTTILKSFFRFLHENRYLKQPIHQGLRPATVRKDDRPNRDLGPGEVIQLLDYYRDRNPIMFTLIHVLVGTGMRNDELCRLKVSDVRFDPILGGFYLHVIGKGNKQRDIPLRDKVMDSIMLYRKTRLLSADFPSNNDEPLFPNSRWKAFRPSYFATMLGDEIEKVPILSIQARKKRITPHEFRHSFAIISYMNNSDVYAIMRALGHEKIETTMIYLQKIMEREQHVVHQWKDDALGRYI
ncbi:tyrosine-type recombinase/integrase [Domibacillus indicus]|uniref:tyrosine-type recombinase/integrase n=1 Tax=Domibacillus indicus TaxID=1437523 RepID=UPI00203FA40A|nr:tyrosine-type recombinase/integrase [Domibacillus indicus]MCM3791328.1 tyrosine-type recombinase/integrase [Domibacillus indicus]